MENNSLEKLKKIVEEREKRVTDSGGEIFALWGILNIITIFVSYFIRNTFLFKYGIVWIVMIIVGNLIEFKYLKLTKMKKGKGHTIWSKTVSQLWLFITSLIPVLFLIFPFVIKIYEAKAIFPLVLILIAIGTFVSGLITSKLSLKIGGGNLIIFSILGAIFITNSFLISAIVYSGAMLFGLVIPGIWSLYEARE